MFRQIWQWIKGLFQRLFGGGTHLPNRGRQEAGTTQDASTLKRLDDSDYEYLFRQLLEGVAYRWQQERVVQWFEGLKGRVTYAEWAAWLRRFGERVLASPASNNELAMRLVLLGEQLQPIPSLQEIGEVAYDIGRQLLNRDSSSAAVWEYEGPDAEFTSAAPPLTLTDQGGEPTQPEAADVETITLDELFVRLQQDPNLLQLIAQQMGIETNDPQVIIEAVINQFNQFNAADQSAVDEAVTWFNQGVQQDQAGEFEGAIASYDQALELRPDLYEVWFNRGNALSSLGRFEDAIASFDKAIEIKPDFHEAWHNRGNVLSGLGRFEEANASFEKAKENQAN
jgi:tetratricopeptide (TPR) repeat protein